MASHMHSGKEARLALDAELKIQRESRVQNTLQRVKGEHFGSFEAEVDD